MLKVKATILVVLLVGAGTIGSLWGLNWFFQARIQENCRERLVDSRVSVYQLLRTQAFEDIQRVNSAAAAPECVQALASLPDLSAMTEEKQKEALQQFGSKISPTMDKWRGMQEGAQLLLVGGDARILVGETRGAVVGQSLRGLPAIEDCLQGFARDGIYDLGDGLVQLAVSPVASSGAKSAAGCLVAARPIDATWLKRAMISAQLEAAVAFGGQIAASTIEEKELARLLSKPEPMKDVQYLGTLKKVPLLFGLSSAWAASIASWSGAPEGAQLILLQPLEPLVAPLLHAQKMLWLGAGVLLIVGLLVGIILSFNRSESQLVRLRAAIRLASDGGPLNLDTGGYSGQVAELVEAISKLLEGKVRPMFGAANGSQPRPMPAQAGENVPPAEPTRSAPPTPIDFESLMAEAAPAPEAQRTESPSPSPAAVKAVAASKPTAPAAVREEPVSAPATAPAGGPRVDLPTDLAAMFEEEGRAAPSTPPRPAATVKPAFIPPAPPVAPLGSAQEKEGVLPLPLDEGEEEPGPRSDATVIAQVPDELISLTQSPAATAKMERRPAVSEIPPPPSALPKPPVSFPRAVSQPAADPQETHFKEVYERFVQTKKQCGESTAEVDYERFADKLRRNTAELKARFQCRSVRFQVYIKNGKAALKATPIK